MSENSEGAGPALAAHSKDASAPGPTPASAATGTALPVRNDGETISRLLKEATDFVQRQPLTSMAACVFVGLLCGRMHS